MKRSSPFKPLFPIACAADVARMEETELDQLLTVRSTYEIFCNSAHAFGDKIALTFLTSAEPAHTKKKIPSLNRIKVNLSWIQARFSSHILSCSYFYPLILHTKFSKLANDKINF